MRIDKSVVIPNFTEVDVEIETDEVLGEMCANDILDYLVSDVGCKEIFRKMQIQHDFEKADVEEALGETFGNDKPLTYDDIQDALVNGNLPNHSTVLNFIDDEDIIEHYRDKIKSGITISIDDIIKHIHTVASPSEKLRIMKAVLNTLDEDKRILDE